MLPGRTQMAKLFNSLLLVSGSAALATLIYARMYKRKSADAIVEEFKKECDTPLELLQNIVDAMVSEMEEGLQSVGGSRLKMLPSFVDKLPDGSEKGVFYALDLGGTNFRVLRVVLGGKEQKIVKQEFEEVPIPPNFMKGSAQDLFDFIAEKLADFVSREGEEYRCEGDIKQLGFTFSFPVDQTSINSGNLVRWTKGFKIDEVEGKDVVKFLDDSIQRKNLNMRVAALVNDTVGTLAGAHYNNPDSKIAVILGTGTNACYIEKMDEIKKWIGPHPASGQMVINMEWGNFHSEYLPINFADKELDEESINPGEQIFEKLISGMYLGEIVRKVLLKLANEAHLFGSPVPPKLSEKNTLSSPNLSKIDEDVSPDLSHVSKILEKSFDIRSTSLKVRQIVRQVCEIVARRGARLSAAAIVGVLKKIGRDGKCVPKGLSDPCQQLREFMTVVAVDGGLYEHYSKFRANMNSTVTELLGEFACGLVTVELSKDGSGIGAALLAASCSN